MAGLTSCVPAFKSAIEQALSGQGYDVRYGFPGEELSNTSLWLGASHAVSEIPTLKAGRKRRDEEVEFDFYIDVVYTGGTPAEAETEAFRMLADLENVLADDPTVATVTAAWLSKYDAMANLSPDGGVCRIEGAVTVTNRLN